MTGSTRFVFGSSAAYLAVLVGERAASLLLLPLMTRMLTPSEYSVMLLITNGCGYINILFGFGLALPTLFTSATSDATRQSVCTTIVLSVGAILVAIYATVAFFSETISIYFLHTAEYKNVIALGALWAFLTACTLNFVSIARLTERHKIYFAIQIPALVMQTALIVWLIGFATLGLMGYYIALVIAVLFSTAAYAAVLRHWMAGRFNWQLFVSGTQIGMQMLPWLIGALLTNNSAAFFLTRSGYLDDAGLFAVANGAAGLILSLSNSFENVWTPFVLARKDEPGLAQVQVRIFLIYSSVMLAVASALSLFAREVFAILAGPAFQQGYRFVPALAFTYCVFCFANAFAQGLQARARTVHYAWIGLSASAAFLAICLPLVGRWGAWGFIAAMAGGHLTMLVLLQLTSGRLLPVGYPWARHALMWLIAMAAVAYVFQLELGWASAGIKLLLLAGILALPFVFGAVRWADVRLAKDQLLAAAR